ncbi:hypothetical protein ACIBHX_46560 [Nonomuraea sp. NPDC050536]|uniref:hypothetical protein n=1 Tax=Nonomuraea sp. NPDC050536 TaxID=3364366 RepID=UPI0037CA81F7
MPIRPDQKARYPKNWPTISNEIRFDRAGGWCECAGECGRHTGRCQAIHGEAHPVTGSIVVLTVAHLDHTPENCDPANLKAMCQRCHLAYDASLHASNAARTRFARLVDGQPALFDLPTPDAPTPRAPPTAPAAPAGRPSSSPSIT